MGRGQLSAGAGYYRSGSFGNPYLINEVPFHLGPLYRDGDLPYTGDASNTPTENGAGGEYDFIT